MLDNDRDSSPDNDTLHVVMAAAGNGSVTINGDGTLTYVPNLGFEGEEIITYRISDGQGGFATATVRLWVTADPAALRHDIVQTIADDLPEPIEAIIAEGQVLDAIARFRSIDGEHRPLERSGRD